MSTYSVLPILKKRVDSRLATVMLRITVDGKRAEISIKRQVDPDRWDAGLNRLRGNKEDAKEVNHLIDNLILKLNKITNKLIETDHTLTALRIKKIYLGRELTNKSLLQVFAIHNDMMRSRIGIIRIRKTDGQYVKYIYNAAGVKMSQEVFDASDVLKKKTDYVGEFYFENDTLKFVNHEEGRIVMTGAEPEYQYTLKDHLGNTRITFTTTNNADTLEASMDTENEQEEQANFGAYNSYTDQALDPTPGESASDKIHILNGSGLIGNTTDRLG